MSLKNVTKTDNTKAVIEFAVDAETFEKAVNAVYNKKKTNITLPGFRKGKAPRSLVEKMYGKGFLYEDAINDVLPEAYEAALKESELAVVGKPEFEISSIDENGLVMTATVYLKPEVTVEGYKGLPLTKKTIRVTEDEISAEIEKIRERNARNITVSDRAAENGDITVIDFEGFKDGVAFEGGKGEGFELKLGSGQFIPGFEEQVVGHNVGDEFDINVTFPAEYHAPELAGAPVVFKIKLHEIKAVELPELDDEFAKDVSEFETFAEYRADVKAKLEERHAKDADNGMEGALIDALIAKLEGEIPEAMFADEQDHMLRDYEQRLQMQGLSMDIYFKYTGMTIEQLREQMRPQAERQVRTRLALEAIAKAEAFEITEEMIADEFARLAEEYKMEVEKIKAYIDAADLAKDLAVQKAVAFVKEHAVVTDKVAEAHADDCDCGCHDHE